MSDNSLEKNSFSETEHQTEDETHAFLTDSPTQDDESGRISLCPKKDVYTFESNWNTFSLSWALRPENPFRFAVGSFIEKYKNKVQIVQLDEEVDELFEVCSFDHPYPATKISWSTDKSLNAPDLLATTADYLRIWENKDDDVQLTALLRSNKNSEYCAPLTSFDWNEVDPRIIGTSSIDTTCIIWDIEAQTTTTQIIAHDKEVYDIAFTKTTNTFGSVSADGSVRLFDLRNLEHSIIIYESPGLIPLLRLAWNKLDSNYLGVVLMESEKVVILDIRIPSIPVTELEGHNASINSIAWAPHSSCHICTSGEDRQALIWDLSKVPNPIEEPVLGYTAEREINNLQWSSARNDWIAISFANKTQILRV
ncbi:wd repeat containing protein [Anaeramoeba ignava]|uniref:Wd repeat containing protein n=1 Tax=Anaeramoeba ignava TaxID=1746090 RepID=A0A9Q0LJR4_ANAIG|nr:wd repeat containing protein [Anaeramoeba ignava]